MKQNPRPRGQRIAEWTASPPGQSSYTGDGADKERRRSQIRQSAGEDSSLPAATYRAIGPVGGERQQRVRRS